MVRDTGKDATDPIAQSVAAYEDRASEYAQSTFSFDSYPGLDLEIAEFASRLPEGPIADLGSGSGRDVTFLRSLGRNVISVDRSPSMIAASRRLADNAPPHSIVGDIRQVPICSGQLAGFLCSGTLLHFPRHELDAPLSEMHRVLAPLGLGLVSMKEGMGSGWRYGHGLGPRWCELYSVQDFQERCQGQGLNCQRCLVGGTPPLVLRHCGSKRDLTVGRLTSPHRAGS